MSPSSSIAPQTKLHLDATGLGRDDLDSDVFNESLCVCPSGIRQPGERAVTWLVVAFACLAIIVLGNAIARFRGSKFGEETRFAPKSTARSPDGFRVVRIVDGDTLVIVGKDQIELTLRLAGIDAPEKDQPFGNESSQFLGSLLSDQIVQLDDVKREKFGRVLAHAYLGARRVDLKLVQHGWAWVYPGSDSRVLREAEATARAEKVGLWFSDSPTPPWEWRKKRGMK